MISANPTPLHRRQFCRGALHGAAALLAARPLWAAADEGAITAALRRGGVVIAFRHAFAPGTFDPPGFRLGDCSTQRNLDKEGQAQAVRLGVWFRARGLVPTRVRSSPWCRCIDTAQAAFGQAPVWDALGSPARADAALRSQHLADLRGGLLRVAPGGFEAWVTHQFVLQALAGEATSPAEALMLSADPPVGEVRVLARAILF